MVQAKLNQMADNISDFTPVWPEVKAVVQKRIRAWIYSRGEGSFPPLKDSTLRKRPRRSNMPLDKTGTLIDSLVADTSFTIYDASPTRMELGTSADWAHWHMIDRKHMPKRRPLPPISDAMKSDIRRIIKAHVRSGQGRLV